MKEKIVAVVGPTGAGKSTTGVEIAKRFNGEIISADSRQVYKGLDIGSGKVSRDQFFGKNVLPKVLAETYFHHGIPHHLLDVANPADHFTIVDFKKLAEEKISEIISRGALPILVGGTGFYISSVTDGFIPPQVPPDDVLREELSGKTTEELLEILAGLDPDRRETIEEKNPRRIIRAIEIAKALGKVPPKKHKRKYDSLMLGIDLRDEELKERISRRVDERLSRGWTDEVRRLLASGVPDERIKEFGLGYRIILEYLRFKESQPMESPFRKMYSTILKNIGLDRGKAENEGLNELIFSSEWHYAKRQRNWFKSMEGVRWYDGNEIEKIIGEVKNFIEG